ncbi:MAG: glycosyltransferase involved in cell wall biosynthesis, partial [Limisphaerales bacterium]
RVSNPEVTVILPVQNNADSIYRTLESLSFRLHPWATDLIIIDNNSTDGTGDLARNLGLRVFNELRPGISYARQSGLERARGKYILSVSADVVYPPQWGQSMIQELQDDSELSCTYGKHNFLPEDHPSWLISIYRYFADPAQSLRAVNHEFINVLGCNMAFRRLDAMRVGGYPGEHEIDREGNGESEDGRLALRLTKYGKLKLIDKPDTRVWISNIKFRKDGGIILAFWRRLGRELLRIFPKQKTIHID